MTKVQIMQKLFSEVNGRKKDIKDCSNENNGRFFGKIGPDVTFRGEWMGTTEKDEVFFKYAKEKISLMANGEFLVSVVMKRGSDEFCERKNQLPRTLYEVYTPRCGDKSCINKEHEGLNCLRVFHAPDETIDSVFDNIWDAVTLSKAKEAHIHKYERFNLVPRAINLKNPHNKDHHQPDDNEKQ
jgi:hypothetical protein